jgi:hypothetical protein
MHRIRGKLTYANVVATIALFIALAGGTAFAATQMLPKNSVGPKQLKKGAVTPQKLSAATKAGLTGPVGLEGPRGAVGPQGVQGEPGTPGANLTAATPLASGQTETGVFGDAGGGAGDFLLGVANFVQPLPAPLDGAHTMVLKASEASTPHCPGVGRADPGFFCAYTATESNSARFFAFAENPATGAGGAGRDGAQMFYNATATGASVFGTWAVTAP